MKQLLLEIPVNHISIEKTFFHKKLLCFKINVAFESDNELQSHNKGKKTKNIYKQNPVCNGYYIISELNDVLKSG